MHLYSVAEEVHGTVETLILFFLGLGFFLGGLGISLSGGSATGDWGRGGSRGESVSLLETEAGADRSAGQVLEGVEHHVVHGGLGGVADGQRDGSHILSVVGEGINHGVVGDAEHLSWVDLAVVEHVQNLHSVEEWTDLELVEKGRLTGGDLFTLCDNLHWVDNFDLRLNNLGLDVQGLEEGGLLGVHTSGTGWNGHISWGHGADLGGGLSDLGVKDLLDIGQISVSEDETSVEDEGVSDDIEVGAVLAGRFVLILHFEDSLSHEGVLSHHEDGVNLSEGFAHNANLL